MSKLLKYLFTKKPLNGAKYLLKHLKRSILNEIHRIFSNIAFGVGTILISGLLFFTAFLLCFFMLAVFLIQIGLPVLLAYGINLLLILLLALIFLSVGVKKLKKLKPNTKKIKEDIFDKNDIDE